MTTALRTKGSAGTKKRETSPAIAELPELIGRLEQTKQALEARLRDGNRKIAVARSRGQTVEQWEVLWMTLLRQYEAVCDALAEARALAAA